MVDLGDFRAASATTPDQWLPLGIALPPGAQTDGALQDLLAPLRQLSQVATNLRIVLETWPDQAGPSDQVEGLLGNQDYFIGPMFEGESPEPGLSAFWILELQEVPLAGNFSRLFDLAHLLRAELNLRSAEPDLPYCFRSPFDTHVHSSIRGVTDDRAWALRNMRIPDAWTLAGQGSGIRIAHPDTGYEDHADLDTHRLDTTQSRNFVDPNSDARDPLRPVLGGQPSHGISTGSVIVSEGGIEPPASSTYSGTLPPGVITGVAPQATLIPFRVSNYVYWVFSTPLSQAIHWSWHSRSHVVSVSMGGLPMRSLEAALNMVVGQQLIVVAAAGNQVGTVVWPARYPNCIAAAASNAYDIPWSGSSRGRDVDISAPGEAVWCAFREHGNSATTLFRRSEGTSFATAHVAGVAALWLGHHGPDDIARVCRSYSVHTQDMFRSMLRASARVPDHWQPDRFGAGIVDARDPFRFEIERCIPPDPEVQITEYIALIAAYLAPQSQHNINAALEQIFFALEVVEVFGHEIMYCLLRAEQFSENRINRIRSYFSDAETIQNIFREIFQEYGSETLRQSMTP